MIGSSWTVDARRHTSTDPREDGEGAPIFLLDGSTIIANNYQDLWDGTLDAPINRDERGNPGLSGNVFTGSVANGAKDGRPLGCSDGKTPTVAIGALHSAGRHWMQIYGASAAEPLPLYALSERLTVLDVSEATPPRLKSVVDDRRGQAVAADKSVTFAVTFDEPMKASTVDGSDFGNALPSAVTINSVSRTGDPAVFEVEVTPTEEGRLQLQIAPGAELQDLAGNAMDTSTAIRDDTTITVTPAPLLAGELGILDVTANGGINPATGKAWKAGDRYRLVFVTAANTRAASADLGTYDAFLQRVAGAAGIGGTWKVLGSSSTVDARDHTSTHPDVNGNGEPDLPARWRHQDRRRLQGPLGRQPRCPDQQGRTGEHRSDWQGVHRFERVWRQDRPGTRRFARNPAQRCRSVTVVRPAADGWWSTTRPPRVLCRSMRCRTP